MWTRPGGVKAGEPEFWQTARILGACALSYGVSWLFGLPDPFWALVTTVVVTQPGLRATLSAGRDRVIGTLLGAFAALCVIGLTRLGLPLMPMFWLALIPLAFATALKANLRLSCITLIVVLLAQPVGPSLERPLDRVLEILLGTLISVLVSAITPGPKAEGE